MEIAKKPFTIINNTTSLVPQDTLKLFDFNVEANKVVMTKYTNHPLYRKLEENEKKLSEIESATVCENCGTINESDAKFCVACGSKL